MKRDQSGAKALPGTVIPDNMITHLTRESTGADALFYRFLTSKRKSTLVTAGELSTLAGQGPVCCYDTSVPKGNPMKRKNMTPEQIKQKREEIKFIKQLNNREVK